MGSFRRGEQPPRRRSRSRVPRVSNLEAAATAGKREAAVGAEPGESHRDPAQQDVVITVTTSDDPVLRGEWLQPGMPFVAVYTARLDGATVGQH